MIRAEAHSDDRAVEVKFDATPYFKVAGDLEILQIVKCGYSGDYSTDRIAEAYPDRDETNTKLTEMFKYIEIAGRVRTMGFEVSVEEDDLLKWIRPNRPTLIPMITKYYNTHLQEEEAWEFPM